VVRRGRSAATEFAAAAALTADEAEREVLLKKAARSPGAAR
jgi:hypothetical protein